MISLVKESFVWKSRLGIRLWSVFLWVFIWMAVGPQQTQQGPWSMWATAADNLVERPRVVVITSDNGGGHNAAAEAVEQSLGPQYEVVKLNLFKDKFAQLDKRFMEAFAKEKWPIVWVMANSQPAMDLYIKTVLYSYVKKTLQGLKPDLIVSVFPLGNWTYRDVARDLGIRSVIIPTDLHLDMNLRFFHKERGADIQNQAIVCRAFDLAEDSKILERKGLLYDSLVTGYPVRPQFNKIARSYRQNDPVLMQEMQGLKQQMGIGLQDKVVLIAPMAPIGFGGVGQQAVLDYLQFGAEGIQELLAEEEGKLHFIVATGKNEKLYELIKARSTELRTLSEERVEIHPVKFLPAEDYAKLLAMTDVPIIKPGGATLNEMIALGKRVLIKSDSVQGVPWEKANMEFMVSRGWALPLKYTSGGRVNRADYMMKLRELLQKSGDPIDSPLNEFDVRFKSLVDGLLVPGNPTALSI